MFVKSSVQSANILIGLDPLLVFIPEISDPDVRIKACFQRASEEGGNKVVHKNAPKRGSYGKVFFIKFKNDSEKERWFAVKKPLKSEGMAPHCMANFENCVQIASMISHRNFMGVYGRVLKNSNTSDHKKPFLILEYIEGVPLPELEDRFVEEKKLEYGTKGIPFPEGEKSFPVEKKNELIDQLKDSLLYLFDLRILPKYAFPNNMLITKENLLKFIDFDLWEHNPAIDPGVLAHKLFVVALNARTQFGGCLEADLSGFYCSPDPKKKLAEAIEGLKIGPEQET